MASVIDLTTRTARAVTDNPSAALQAAAAAVEQMDRAQPSKAERHQLALQQALDLLRLATENLTEAARTAPDNDRMKQCVGFGLTVSGLVSFLRIETGL